MTGRTADDANSKPGKTAAAPEMPKPGGPLKRRVVDLLVRYPERAVAVLRGWINETRA